MFTLHFIALTMNYWIVAGGLIVFSTLLTTTVGLYGSSCLLPDQHIGRCMPVQSCKSIHDLLVHIQKNGGNVSEENQRLFTKLHCGTFNKMHHVCCANFDIQLNFDGLTILKSQRCGTYKTNRVISGGIEAALSGLPWMALLIYNNTKYRYRCGGSLISEQYVLTAAHCVVPKTGLFKVRLGEHRISTELDCIAGGRICAPPLEDIDIEEVIIFAGYKKYIDDIALIRLQRRVQYNRHIKPICLPVYDNLRPKVPREFVISGWGRTPIDAVSDVLMVALVPHVDRPQCEAFLKQYRFRLNVTESLICAGNINLIHSCDGDSGGPLGSIDIYNGRPRFAQFGLVSFGVTLCGEDDAPNAYTNVSHYMQWITDNLRY